MALALDQPLTWPTEAGDDIAMLDDLQANILKSHGRRHAAHVFLHFDDAARGRALLRRLAAQVKSARQQLLDAERFKRTGVSGGAFVSVLLSAAGYAALETPEAQWPPEPAFREGMQRRGELLADPPPIAWEALYQQPIHAMALIADDDAPAVRQHARRLRWSLAEEAGVRALGCEYGRALINDDGMPIEHFGYADGISMPTPLRDRPTADELEWNPEVALDHVLAADPGGAPGVSFGSYMVFRKLEQNVRAFKSAERQLAQALGLSGEDAERAGAMLVGRFEDGTPLTLSGADGLPREVLNNFTYAGDQHGRRCPFQAHIRKVNPRGADQRARLLIRRGITYGRRGDDLNQDLPPDARPSGGVGLLFMSYGSGIEAQFEFVQRQWANDPHYLGQNTGLDPLIGQQPAHRYRWPAGWGMDQPPLTAPLDSGGFVTLKGGEYFFAPCISWLRSLYR